MKRRLLLVAIFLLAGAVVNVTVAWGCAVLIDLNKVEVSAWGNTDGQLFVVVSRPGRIRIVWERKPFEATAASHERMEAAVNPCPSLLRREIRSASGAQSDAWSALGSGWPMLCLWSERHDQIITGKRQTTLRGAMLPALKPWTPGNSRVLPLMPIWPGFAVNTLFYSAVLWLLICGPVTLRRLIRMKRGRCVKCGYPLGDSPVCTECGKPLRERVRAST